MIRTRYHLYLCSDLTCQVRMKCSICLVDLRYLRYFTKNNLCINICW